MSLQISGEHVLVVERDTQVCQRGDQLLVPHEVMEPQKRQHLLDDGDTAASLAAVSANSNTKQYIQVNIINSS